MGMAASQARLLSLTARLHDVEFKAQNVMSEKLALATQKDALYQEYCEALDSTVFKVAFHNGDYSTTLVDANFNSLCTYNPQRCQQFYALRNNQNNKIITTPEVVEKYENYGNDKYAFAYAMLGFENSFNWLHNGGYDANESGKDVGVIGGSTNNDDEDLIYVSEGNGKYSLYMTECERNVYNMYCEEDPTLKDKYDTISQKSDKSDKQKSLDDFREYLYEQYSEEIFEQMNIDKENTDSTELLFEELNWNDIEDEFNYYVNLWSAIKEAGGCEAIDSLYSSGEQGNTWFKNMVESGIVSILAYDLSGRNKVWSETSFATSTNNNYLQEVDDDVAAKKAEAKYEHELRIINDKDTKFDNELNVLETERSAIMKEQDSIKKVIQDNADRTFKIFS